MHYFLPGVDNLNTNLESTNKFGNDGEDPKDLNSKNIEDKIQYRDQHEKICVALEDTNSVLLSAPRTPTVLLKPSGEISVEIVQKTDDQTKISRHQLKRSQNPSPLSTIRQYSKNSSETSPEDDGSKNHFRKLHNKSTLILFGIALMFLFCNIPRLGVKIFHIYHQGRSVQKHFNACAATGQYHAPVAIFIMGNVSNICYFN